MRELPAACRAASQIEDHEIRVGLEHGVERLLPVARMAEAAAPALQVISHPPRHVRLVLDDRHKPAVVSPPFHGAHLPGVGRNSAAFR